MTATRLDNAAFDQLVADVATPAQSTALAKMAKMGWRVTKVLGRRGQPADISLGAKGQGVWLRPDGTLVRPQSGRKCAELPRR